MSRYINYSELLATFKFLVPVNKNTFYLPTYPAYKRSKCVHKWINAGHK